MVALGFHLSITVWPKLSLFIASAGLPTYDVRQQTEVGGDTRGNFSIFTIARSGVLYNVEVISQAIWAETTRL